MGKNYFKIKLPSLNQEIYYYYHQQKIQIGNCSFSETKEDDCPEYSKYINMTKFTFQEFLSDFRVTIEDLELVSYEVKTKIIQIDK